MRVEKQERPGTPSFITTPDVEPDRHQIPLPGRTVARLYRSYKSRFIGVAEEIESYPCPFCTDRVFLTAFGLEKHALERHNDQIGMVNQRIQQISEEWERRRLHNARRAHQLGITQGGGRGTTTTSEHLRRYNVQELCT